MTGLLIPKELKLFYKILADATFAVNPARAGIQNRLKILDSGSRFALYTMRCRASLARNDDFLCLQEFSKRLL